MKQEKIYIKKAAAFLNKSADTLRKWDKKGKLMAKRDKKNKYRYYTESQLKKFRRSFNGGF